ncbi:hypothetical protein J4Q44_G00116920 [Coregonus suidteri]|uniref:Aminopeptidase N n=1 Tax=Coregonus suidteri TaxID=861788 RepID=A0AAN8M654_9TELE
MENWGLVTYRETNLLYDPLTSSNGNKERTATIIAHELAHMKDLIVLDDVHRVFAVDALASSHPLSSKDDDIQKPEQISEQFDAISYSKAVDASDMELPGTVHDIMNRWVLQMGFPVVTINTATGQITQEHFLLDPDSVGNVPPSDFKYNQVNAIRMACSTGLVECQNLTKGWYSQWMADPDNNLIHPNLRTTVYCSAIAAGGAAEWDFGWNMFKNATIASEADKLMSSLACTKDHELLNKYLRYTLDSDKIRKQDATSVIVYISSNVEGQTLAWDFVTQNWEYMFTQYGVGSFSFANLISGVTMRFSTKTELEQLQKFKEDNSEIGFGSGTLALEQATERTTANIKWVDENKKEVWDWFLSETA